MDTRCYSCIINPVEYDDLDGTYSINNPKYSNYVYQENGIFRCPRCGHILNKTTDIFTTTIQRKYNEYGELETEILETDQKLTEDGKYVFEQDMYELDVFEDIPFGKYKLDVLWYYYKSGGYENPYEWDVKIEILSEEDISRE
jgi:hypothetical protein